MAWNDYRSNLQRAIDYKTQNPQGGNGLGSQIGGALNAIGLNGASPSDQAKMDRLNGVGSQGMGFAGDARANYNMLTGRLGGALDYLDGQMRGRNSVAGEQLRQGLQQNIGAQRSLAASASPNDAAMAAFGAGNNIARLGYGMSGQQALAGIAERNAAAQQYASLLGQARGQDLQGTLGGYGVANQSYGSGLNAQRDPTFADQFLLPAMNGFTAIAARGGK